MQTYMLEKFIDNRNVKLGRPTQNGVSLCFELHFVFM